MPIVSQQPIDIAWAFQLQSATTYVGKNAAITAAVALSAANGNAPVQIIQIIELVDALGPTGFPQVDLPGAGVPLYFVQLQSGTTYYPLETARVAAYAYSNANAQATVSLGTVVEVVAAP